MNSLRYLFLFLIAQTLFWVLPLSAQNDLGFKLKVVDKLPLLNNISAMTQDAQGFIWIGGERGVLKYNGYDSVFYPAHWVHALIQGSDNSLWLVSPDGLMRFNHQLDKFETVLWGGSNPNHEGIFVPLNLVESPAGQLWIGNFDGSLFHYDTNTEQLTQYPLPSEQGLPDQTPQSLPMTVMSDGSILVGFLNQLYRFKDGNYGLSDDTRYFNSPQQQIKGLAPRQNGGLLVTTNQGLYLKSSAGDGFKPLVDKIHGIQAVHSNEQNIYVSTNDGVHHINQQLEVAGSQQWVDSQVGKVKMRRLWGLFKDRQNNLWGYNWTSLFMAPVTNIHFVNHDLRLQNGNLLPDTTVTAMEQKHKTLWVATEGQGILRQSADKPGFEQIHINSGTQLVYKLFYDNSNTLWAGSEDGLARFNKSTQSFETVDLAVDLPSLAVNDIDQDGKGNLWLTLPVGNLYYDPQAQKPLFSTGDNYLMTFVTKDNTTLAGSVDGVYQLDAFGSAEKRFPLGELTTDFSDEQPFVVDIAEDDRGRIWLATGLGTYVSDTSGENFIAFDLNDDSPNLPVNAVHYRPGSGIWLADSGGIYQVDTTTMALVSNIQHIPGYSDSLRWGALKSFQSDTLYLGGNNGLVTLEPGLSSQPLGVAITAVRSGNQVFRPQSTKQAQLPEQMSASQDLSFHFANLKYDGHQGMQYRYRLEGYQREWQRADGLSRQVDFTNLPHGNYRFIVQSRMPHSEWSQSSVSFSIDKPFYLTWWAFLTYLAALLLIVRLAVTFQTARLARQNQLLSQKVEERTTQISEQNEQIRALSNHKDLFYANISHEFRTPLTVMLMPITKMLDKAAEDDKLQWQAAQNQGMRLTKMVDRLIAFAKQAGEVQPQVLNYHPKAQIQQLFDSFVPLAQSRSITMQLEMSLDAQMLPLSEDALEHILGNLLSNAIKYSPEGAEVSVDVYLLEQNLYIEVKDNGYGIAPEHQQKIFERFYRIEHDQHQGIDGVGIGLAMVKETVLLNGGQINLYSEQGEGCCFTVRLPVADPLPTITPQAQTVKQTGSSDTPQQRHKLLIVEDNADLRNMLSTELAPWFETASAVDGADGIEKVQSFMPDLVLSDLMMPNKNGFELCAHIKQHTATSHIPVILLTAKGDKDSRIAGWQIEADDYLDKPFDLDNLHHRIDNLIRSRQKLAELYRSQVLQSSKTVQIEHEQQQSPDDKFIARLKEVLQQHYSDGEFSTNELAEKMYLGARQLQRKMKTMMGVSPSDFLKQYRLQRAKELLLQNMQAAQVALEVGFSSPAYFGACFKAEFGQTPVQYQQSVTQ